MEVTSFALTRSWHRDLQLIVNFAVIAQLALIWRLLCWLRCNATTMNLTRLLRVAYANVIIVVDIFVSSGQSGDDIDVKGRETEKFNSDGAGADVRKVPQALRLDTNG